MFVDERFDFIMVNLSFDGIEEYPKMIPSVQYGALLDAWRKGEVYEFKSFKMVNGNTPLVNPGVDYVDMSKVVRISIN